jgi:hypothetical protein
MEQHGLVATWQMVADGMTEKEIRHVSGSLRRVHDGVYLSGHAPLTEHQRWWAATLTKSGSVLSRGSAAALHGFRRSAGGPEVVTRHGSGGPVRFGNVLVHRSRHLARADTVSVAGLVVTTPGRTLVDLAARLRERSLRRAVREALRVKAVTGPELREALDRHRGRRGVAVLRLAVDEYHDQPMGRTRSDAEAIALALLAEAGVEAPAINVLIAGEEADLSWRDRRLIVELDGPDFHRFRSEDARKEMLWRAAGWTVRRLSTNDVYDLPDRLFDLIDATKFRRGR